MRREWLKVAKIIAWSPLVLLMRLFSGFGWLFPRPIKRQLPAITTHPSYKGLWWNVPHRNIPPQQQQQQHQTGPKVYYIDAVSSNWRLGLGLALPVLVICAWFGNAAFATNTLSMVLYLACSIIWLPAVYDSMKLAAALLYGESVLIGFIGDYFPYPEKVRDADETALKLAHSMAANAMKRNVWMVLINRNDELRAYFRNEDEAVLIRAAS